MIEPEIKLVFAALFVLAYLGARANSQAVLPAFVLGLAMSGHYVEHRMEQERLRVVAFAFLTPFFFVKGGLNVSLSAVWANLGVLGLLVIAKMVPKFGGVYPLARRYCAPHAAFTTLLMSTGLTFGTITSLYGLPERNHRPHAVLAADHRGRLVGDRPHRDRAALLSTEFRSTAVRGRPATAQRSRRGHARTTTGRGGIDAV